MKRRPQNDYSTVKRSRFMRANPPDAAAAAVAYEPTPPEVEAGNPPPARSSRPANPLLTLLSNVRLKRGHLLSYSALWFFTVLLYARPAEFYPSAFTASITLVVGLITLGFFIPSQLSLEGNLTARPREVNLVLLFCLTGFLSVPLAMDRIEAWTYFSGSFIRGIVIFIVMVNVVRTETRLKALLFVAVAAAVWLSIEAMNDYRLGLTTVEGYRADGRGSGIFGNSNDMALYLVTILPISVALAFSLRSRALRLLFGASAGLILPGIVLSFSRGAFLGLVVLLIFLAIKVGQRHRLKIAIAGFLITVGLFLFAPGSYGSRLLSIFLPSLDPVGSADIRRRELLRSIYIALRHPILGIGMGNYQSQMSLSGIVTHNSYTQVASEMGLAALVCYVLFMITPIRKLGQILREISATQGHSNLYYLSLGLLGALISYMVSSFFLSVAYSWYVYYLVGYAVCLRRLYESEVGREVVLEKRNTGMQRQNFSPTLIANRSS